MIPALSIRGPWWWFIFYGGKDIENRGWSTRYRGPVYIHASKWFDAEEMQYDWEDALEMYRNSGGTSLPPVTLRDLRDRGGCIVGRAEIVDCVQTSASPWFMGPHGFLLRNPVAFATPVPCRGARRLFPVPVDVMTRISAISMPEAMIGI
jgi:hypothetical protein